MKKMFDKFRIFNSRSNFRRADLTETAEAFCNPDRGWYQIVPFVLGEDFEKQVSFEDLKGCLLPEERLVLILLDIGRYAEEKLPDMALDQMRQILGFFAENKKDILVRALYDREGRAPEREPSLFSRVSMHMEQVAAVVAQFREAVFVYQGLLVGNWGEMHGSRYLEEKHLASLAAHLQDHIRGKQFLAVRTPAHLRKLITTGEWNEAAQRGIGLFDDAMFGSETDCGTFSAKDGSREEELRFLEQLTLQVPFGGEAVYGDGSFGRVSPEVFLGRLRQLHVTYLNRQHDLRLLEQWKQTPYPYAGAFGGKSLYEYIGAHLGYRFWVRDVHGRGKTQADGTSLVQLELTVQNLGFAPIYRETESFLCWEDAEGRNGCNGIALDVRSIKGQQPLEQSLSIELPQEAVRPCRLFLMTKRRFDGTVIRFANHQTADGKVLLGEW